MQFLLQNLILLFKLRVFSDRVRYFDLRFNSQFQILHLVEQVFIVFIEGLQIILDITPLFLFRLHVELASRHILCQFSDAPLKFLHLVRLLHQQLTIDLLNTKLLRGK